MTRYLIFAAIGLTLFTQNAGNTAVAVAFPEIASAFDARIVLAGWVLSSFQLAVIIMVPLAGKASDALGRKRTFTFFVLLFVIGSFLCAIAPNIYWLILFRVVQGLGSGGFLTSAVGIAADTFPESRLRSVGFVTSILTVGSAVGPNVGGWLTESFGWRYIFWASIPPCVAALAIGAALLKRDSKMAKPAFDLRGAGLLAASLGAMIVGLTVLGGGEVFKSWPAVAALFVAGSAATVLFVRYERGAANPLIEMRMLRERQFAAANVFNTAFGLSIGVFSFLPLYAVEVYGASTFQSGLLTSPRAIGMVAGSVLTTLQLARWGYRWPMLIGITVEALGIALLGFESGGFASYGLALSGLAVMVVVVSLTGFAQGFVMPAANNACIELMPDRVATITGMRQTCRNVGQMMGIALASIVLDRSVNLAQGFQYVLFGTALIALLTVPSIVMMPRSPSDAPSQRLG
ncbi:MAG: MFS transporter [Chloroflexi bacterium]|nr:MFS transporter [Chloroflexota bacterium]